MSNIFLTHMHRVLDAGISLKERLENGERPDLATEQATLKMLLMGDNELRVMPDYVGEGNYGQSIMGQSKGGAPTYRGVKYALTAWLDEMFINDGPRDWADSWNEQKLESSLYQSNDRGWMFWEQARLAELRPGTEMLEAFYWCVMLGFRGELREEPQKLDNWARAARARLVSGQQTEWPLPPEREVPSNVPPRGAKDRFQNMMMAWNVALLLAVPLVSFIVIRMLGK
jgi:type IV/VI secretion system ImpK/VasF family protein